MSSSAATLPLLFMLRIRYLGGITNVSGLKIIKAFW